MDIKNKVKAFITAVMMTAAPMAMDISSASAEDYIVENAEVLTLFGDVNFDGSVGISDAVQLNRYLLGKISELGNVRNADLLADGVIDIYDMVYLRKQLVADNKPAGTKLSVKVVDMMSGEPLESADIELSEMNGNYLYQIGGAVSTNGEDVNYYGLPADKAYKYFLTVNELPKGYDLAYKTWDQVVIFDIEAGTAEKELVVRVAADDAEKNVKFTHMDWCQGRENIGYGNLFITDKDGNYYYQRQYTGEMSLPDGDYHADFNFFDYPVSFVEPDSDFAKMIKENYPDAQFEDLSDGIDFSVVNGKPDRELFLNFGPKSDTGNNIKVNCYDSLTGEPLKGVKLSLIEAPYSYAKKESWISDGTTKVFTDLFRTGPDCYQVVVDSVPEGYLKSSKDQGVSFGYVYDYSSDFNFYFTPYEGEKNLSFDVLTWPDKKPYTGNCTYTVMQDNSIILSGIKPGEKFGIKDGEYMLFADSYDEADPYRGADLSSEVGQELAKETDVFADGAAFRSDMAKFTVKDGRIDKNIVLYVCEKDKGRSAYEIELMEEEKRQEEERIRKEEEYQKLLLMQSE
ncbi:dockerin type I repeat-containing protein [Ruminococcus flavefaciens]|uniref:dockerin type I repeat-containing protein n=1 Tax=Ruminococcus flavefaciens TaxID=1265 RepID=UPI0026EB28B9|nr:dockerin type I repeat-containing protein [Ruminococcus flavefaciens]